MSLEIIHWYTVDTDGATIVAAGAIQAAHIGSIHTEPDQTLRTGRKANGLDVWERAGELIPYTPAERLARRNPPGRGYVWRAGKTMGWEDRRPTAWAREDKIALLTSEHAKRMEMAVTVVGAGSILPTPQNLHRLAMAAQMAPAQLRPDDMRIRGADGTVRTWPTAAAFKVFASLWTVAASQHFADVDRWKDDLLDRIQAAKINLDIDAITW